MKAWRIVDVELFGAWLIDALSQGQPFYLFIAVVTCVEVFKPTLGGFGSRNWKMSRLHKQSLLRIRY